MVLVHASGEITGCYELVNAAEFIEGLTTTEYKRVWKRLKNPKWKVVKKLVRRKSKS
jgi:hypothetical protein